MRRNHFTSFLFGSLVVVVSGIGVYALQNSYIKANGELNFAQLKSSANRNQLTQAMWDSLIEGLAHQIAPVPSGAIMAFNLTTCPQGWVRFAEADGRFLLGANGNFRVQGGSATTTLNWQNLPPHSQYFKDTVFIGRAVASNIGFGSDGAGRYYTKNFVNNPHFLYQSVEEYPVRSISNQQYGLRVESSSYVDTQKGYGPVIGMRKTDSEICAPVGGKIGNYHTATFQNLDNLSSCSTQAQAFSVQNPYIKVLYCQKI